MSWPAIDCLEHHPAFAVAGVAATLPADDAAAIGRLWQEADPAAIAAAVSDRTSDRLFVLRDGRGDDAGGQVEMVVGYAVPPGATAAAPMAVREVPAATYARIDAAGRPALAELWATLAAGDLPRSGPDFEVHGAAGEDGADRSVSVYVAIDPAAFAHPALAARLAAVARAGVLGRLVFDERGLIPAVAQQHDTGEVLMVAWMDRTAVEETLATRRVTYWSRSRRRLWRKGETSGHVQRLVDLRIDCDGDTLLVLVDQTGPACHTGERTCFFRTARSGVIAEVADKGPAAPPHGRSSTVG